MDTTKHHEDFEERIEQDRERVEDDRERVEAERERVETERERVEDDRERVEREREREDHEHRTPHFEIFIDKDRFEVEQAELTGNELRALPQPPVGEDRDLWEEVQGAGDDKKIGNGEVVKMRSGLRFFTTPRAVTPGATDAPAC